MTPKQRIAAAFKLKKPACMVAMFEVEFQLFKEMTGKDPTVGHDYAKLSPKEKEIALGQNAEILVNAAQICGHDAVRGIGGYWEVSPGHPAFLWLPSYEDQVAQLRAVKKAAGDEYFVIAGTGGMVGCIPDGNTIEAYVQEFFDDPEGVHKKAEAILRAITEGQKIMQEAGADGIINCTDIAFNTGTFLSPSQLREFFFPYLTRWAEECKKDDIVSILHTDGDVTAVMPDLLESGITALQCIDPLGGMDIVKLMAEVEGKMALIGNIDCSIIQTGPVEAIEAACRRVLEGCKNRCGFIFGGCNAIYKGIPAAHYQVMINARKTIGNLGEKLV